MRFIAANWWVWLMIFGLVLAILFGFQVPGLLGTTSKEKVTEKPSLGKWVVGSGFTLLFLGFISCALSVVSLATLAIQAWARN